MSVLRAPGTAPRTMRRFRSPSTFSTRSLRTVTRRLPMWPGMRLPLTTRPGNVPAPMEPGARSRSFWPWDLGPPAKLWRFITPWKPRPLVVEVTSTRSPSWNWVTVSV